MLLGCTMDREHANEGIYTGFAAGYDQMMRDVDFEEWALHILRLSHLHDLSGTTLLNLACGTGAMEPTWITEGYRVVGIDQSAEMIEQAQRKSPPDTGAVFAVGDMRTFEREGRFDLITCLYDSLNYLTEPEDVQRCFQRVKAHLAPRGCFIFDIATEANILENFTSTTYAENLEDFAYIWENSYNQRTKICRSDFAFFHRVPETGHFLRRTETHHQRMYTSRELVRWLKGAGLQVLGSYDGIGFDPPKSSSDRIHFVAAHSDLRI